MLMSFYAFSYFYTIRHTIPFFFFFFNDTATTEIYTLSLHDALPICEERSRPRNGLEILRSVRRRRHRSSGSTAGSSGDRKSTRLNSSHGYISYAVFCLKKKKKEDQNMPKAPRA